MRGRSYFPVTPTSFSEWRQAEDERKTRGQKRKREMDELEEMKKKKKRTEESMHALMKDADSFAQKAEDKADMRLLAKSNAFRKAAKEKEAELNKMKDAITEKVTELANA